jgi:hypothetical protein
MTLPSFGRDCGATQATFPPSFVTLRSVALDESCFSLIASAAWRRFSENRQRIDFSASDPASKGGHRPKISPSVFFRKASRNQRVTCRCRVEVACYLCNRFWKTVNPRGITAVPLLPVQGCSVIVISRRRGASRGRPVLGGSLKSLAFMRECPKARSG